MFRWKRVERLSGNGPMTDAERYFFDLNGFLIRRGALDAAAIQALHTAIERLRVPSPGTDLGSQRFSRYLTADPAFRDLIDHPAALDVVLELCGPTARLDHTYGIIMAPGTDGLGLHGGGTPHDPAQYYDVRQGEIYNGLIAVQWVLVDHDPGFGGFRCVPGSHKANFPLPDDLNEELVTDVPLVAGDVMFFTEALTHGTSTWRAPYNRMSLFYKFAPGHMAWGRRENDSEFSTAALRDACTPRQLRFLQPPAVYPHDPI
jgi:Phytanoyl-CoA dioxygenase (PhyH)